MRLFDREILCETDCFKEVENVGLLLLNGAK